MCTNRWRRVAGFGGVVLAVSMSYGEAEAGSGALLDVTPLVAASLHARAQEGGTHTRDATPRRAEAKRPQILIPLYCVFAGLQIADAHSTYVAVQRGVGESNPLMAGVAHSPGGLVLAKVATTATTIAVTELLWRKNRKAAVITTIALDVAYAAVVAHNYDVSRGR